MKNLKQDLVPEQVVRNATRIKHENENFNFQKFQKRELKSGNNLENFASTTLVFHRGNSY